MPSTQELRRRHPSELHRLDVTRVDGGREVGVGRLCSSSSGRERVAQLATQAARLVHVELPELEGEAIPLRRAVEGERVGRACGRGDRVEAGPLGVVGCPEVRDESFRIGILRRLEQAREAAVRVRGSLARELVRDELANAIVVRLDLLLAVPDDGSDQLRRAEGRERRLLALRGDDGRARGELTRDRPGGYRGDLEEPPCVVGELRDAPDDEVFEPNRRDRPGGRAGGGEAADERVDEERAPGRLLRDRCGDVAAVRMVRTEERKRQGARLVLVQRLERDVDDVNAIAELRPRVAQDRERNAVGGLLAPVARDQQERRRLRGAKQLAEQRGAVDVSPLQIVDP